MTYRIREVDGTDEEVADTLSMLHELCFGNTAPMPEFYGHWYLGYCKGEPIAFAGMVESSIGNAGYLKRSGVLPAHRGNGLQVRLLRAREARARRNGWTKCISDTTDNIPSANSLIRAGYRLFKPNVAWAFENTLYWRKDIQ